MRGNGYVVGFAVAICVVCSLLLSGVSSALKDRQEENRALDRQKNILVALGFKQAEAHDTIRASMAMLGAIATVEDLVRASLKKGK